MRRVHVLAVLSAGVVVLGWISGCDLLDQWLGGSPGGGGNTPTAVIRAEPSDDLVAAGLNPDLRPPLRYQFTVEDSTDSDGLPVGQSPHNFDYAWDFDNGQTLGPGGYPSPRIFFYEQGTYNVSLTVTQWGGGSDTAVKTIVIGEPWLEIMSVDWTPRQDGNLTLSVGVRNQSDQPLRSFQVQLKVNGAPALVLGEDLTGKTPDRLLPGAGYFLTGVIAPSWTQTLDVVSHFCTPWE